MRHVRRLFLLTLLGVALLVPAPVAHAERTLALSSGSFRFDVTPGKGGKGEVVVMNEGDEEMNVLVYVADQRVDDAGNVTFVTPNRDNLQQALSGPSGWVRIDMPSRAKAIGNTPYIVLKPDEKVPVKFSFEVPDKTPSGDHNTILFFEMFTFETGDQGMTSKVQGRVGSRLKIRVAGPVIERLDAAPFWVDSIVIGDRVPFRFTLVNDGNIDKRVNTTIALLDRNEATKVRSQVATDAAVYAGTNREIAGEIASSEVLLGRFTARLTVDFEVEDEQGLRSPIVKDRTVWVVPMWFAIATAALAAVLGLWAIWRVAMRAARRRARRERERSRQRRASAEPEPGGESAASARDGDDKLESA